MCTIKYVNDPPYWYHNPETMSRIDFYYLLQLCDSVQHRKRADGKL